jgi:hypothetical protein
LTLFDDGKHSVICATHDGKRKLAVRWNADTDSRLNFPIMFGCAWALEHIWRIVPPFLEIPMLHGLLDELAGTENRIAVERRRYNVTLQDYNTYLGLFPNNIFAGWAGFKPNPAYFAASEASREAPKVQFPGPPKN